MPKAPITYRQAYFVNIRGSGNPPLIRRLDFNSVETELGTMVEPVPMINGRSGEDKISNIDLTDAAFNQMTLIQEEDFQARFNCGGNPGCIDVNI